MQRSLELPSSCVAGSSLMAVVVSDAAESLKPNVDQKSRCCTDTARSVAASEGSQPRLTPVHTDTGPRRDPQPRLTPVHTDRGPQRDPPAPPHAYSHGHGASEGPQPRLTPVGAPEREGLCLTPAAHPPDTLQPDPRRGAGVGTQPHALTPPASLPETGM